MWFSTPPRRADSWLPSSSPSRVCMVSVRSYADVITKFSRMDRSPNFLSYGAPFACRELSYKRVIQHCVVKDSRTYIFLNLFYCATLGIFSFCLNRLFEEDPDDVELEVGFLPDETVARVDFDRKRKGGSSSLCRLHLAKPIQGMVSSTGQSLDVSADQGPFPRKARKLFGPEGKF